MNYENPEFIPPSYEVWEEEVDRNIAREAGLLGEMYSNQEDSERMADLLGWLLPGGERELLRAVYDMCGSYASEEGLSETQRQFALAVLESNKFSQSNSVEAPPNAEPDLECLLRHRMFNVLKVTALVYHEDPRLRGALCFAIKVLQSTVDRIELMSDESDPFLRRFDAAILGLSDEFDFEPYVPGSDRGVIDFSRIPDYHSVGRGFRYNTANSFEKFKAAFLRHAAGSDYALRRPGDNIANPADSGEA